MIKYRWIITKDHLDESANGVEGPYGLNPELNTNKTQFKMYDDDHELHYTGYIFGDFEGFEPLDDFGEGNSGCAGIKLKENGVWDDYL